VQRVTESVTARDRPCGRPCSCTCRSSGPRRRREAAGPLRAAEDIRSSSGRSSTIWCRGGLVYRTGVGGGDHLRHHGGRRSHPGAPRGAGAYRRSPRLGRWWYRSGSA
jgi:hypothetical protein